MKNKVSLKFKVQSLKFNLQRLRFKVIAFLCVASLLFSCGDTEPSAIFKNDYVDNTPTSGKLKMYYDEGLQLPLKAQEYAFEAMYPNAQVEIIQGTESEAVQALYNDSCKAIFIQRFLSKEEQKAFQARNVVPHFSEVAKTGVALITNMETPLSVLDCRDVKQLLTGNGALKDTAGNPLKLNVVLDKNNSSVIHYLQDSLLKSEKFGANCSVLKGSIESINYVAQNKNTIAIIDFAWLSDVDDSLYKAYREKIKFIAIGNNYNCFNTTAAAPHRDSLYYEYPSQSSFKLNTYPFTRGIYVIRRSSEFALAKGFQSFIYSPMGQTAILKQGLLPTRQQERLININIEPMKVN